MKVDQNAAPVERRAPEDAARMGAMSTQRLSDAGRLSQFGAYGVTLAPGARSSFRHWHAAEDELVYVLSGDLILIEDAETPMTAGDVACWPANHPVGHCLENRSTADASYLTIGTRSRHDTIHYPDHDLITRKDGPARSYSHADGTPRNRGR